MAKQPTQKPNIVFIIVDQWRGDCLSVLGHPDVDTPNLDMLSKQGTLFTSAYTSCPSCVSARASMFTGMRPTSTGFLGYQDGVTWTYENTLPQTLSDHGYQTHCVGKTHFFPQRNHLGFHSLESYEANQVLTPDYVNDYHEWLREQSGGKLSEFDHGVDWNSWYARPSHLPEELHNNSWVVTRGIDFIKRRDPMRPLFLNLSFHRPHPPIDPPQAYYDMYRDRPLKKRVPVGAWAKVYDQPVREINDWRGHLPDHLLDHARRAYYAQIAHIDNQIGRFIVYGLRALKEPTWVFFVADHGEMLGDHHLFRKTYAYEGSAKLPFMVVPPQGSKVGVCDAPVVQEDIMPSMLEAAGIPIPKSVEGSSLLGLMNPGKKAAPFRKYLHGEHSTCYGNEGMQYLCGGGMKYVWTTKTGQEQLFNLKDDPDEEKDLSQQEQYKDVLVTWRKRMVKELKVRKQDKLSDGKKLTPGRNLPAYREGGSKKVR